MARLLLPSSLGRLPVSDVALAVAMCIFAVGGLVTGQVQEYPLAITVPIATASTLAIAVRTRYPIAVAGVVSALAIAQALFAGHSSGTLWDLAVLLITADSVGAECEEGWALGGLGLVVGGQFTCEWLDHGSDYPFDTLVFGGVWLFGRATRTWRNQATYAELHRHDLAQIAVAEERTRIARELHDVVAHSLSVIAIQANAAEAALAKQPDRAGPPLRAIRDSAREALTDMRQLLHVLRDDSETDSTERLSPPRGLRDLPQLVAAMRESGLAVEAEIHVGDDLSSGLELAAYRIAQEGLTNVRKHAGEVPTHLLVLDDGHQLRVEVHNEPPMAEPTGQSTLSTGNGLLGARERARAAGGWLEAGPTATGGFDLVACLPLTATDGVAP